METAAQDAMEGFPWELPKSIESPQVNPGMGGVLFPIKSKTGAQQWAG